MKKSDEIISFVIGIGIGLLLLCFLLVGWGIMATIVYTVFGVVALGIMVLIGLLTKFLPGGIALIIGVIVGYAILGKVMKWLGMRSDDPMTDDYDGRD